MAALIFCLPLLSAAQPDYEVPFDFLHNQIVVAVSINGSGPFRAVIDTGTHATTVSEDLVHRLGLPKGRRVRGTGAGAGEVSGFEVKFDEVAVGPASVRGMSAVAMNLDRLSSAIGRQLDCVLGSGFLASRIVQIDYFRRRLVFWSASPFGAAAPPPDSARAIAFPMRFVDRSILPVIEDCIINGVRIPVTIDTGSSFGLILFPHAIRALGIEELAKSGTQLGAFGYGGKARLTKGWVRSFALKHMDLGAIEVAYVLSGYEAGDASRRGGNVGNALLQDFRLTLDYVNRVLVLESTEDE